MNIFVTDVDPKQSAVAMDDKRLIKMILESAQLMSTVMHMRGATPTYRPTHKGHPCTIWVNQSRANYEWLLNHFVELSLEYTKRFGKIHKSYLLLEELTAGRHLVPSISHGPTPFANATKFKDEYDIIVAYRLAMVDKWLNDKRKPIWTNSQPPDWKERYEQILLQRTRAKENGIRIA